MKFTKALICAACSVLLLAGCATDKKAIITVNGEAITMADYNKAMDVVKSSPQFKQAPADQKKADSPIMLMAKQRVVQDLIAKKLLEQEYAKRNITANEEEMKAKKEEIIKQIGSKEKFEEALKQNNVTEQQVNQDILNEVKLAKLIASVSGSTVSDKDVKDFYTKNKQQFNFPQRVKASHILIEANSEAIKKAIIDADKDGKLTAAQINEKVNARLDEKLKKAKELRAKAAANPKQFAQLAKEFSDDKASGVKGGDLGYFPKEAMVKEFSDVAFKLKPGVVSEVVKTPYGYHIILVADRAAAGVAPYDVVKEEIRAYLKQTKEVEALQNLFNGLKSSAKIEYGDPSFNPENIENELREGSIKAQKKQEKAMRKLQKNNNGASSAPNQTVAPVAAPAK